MNLVDFSSIHVIAAFFIVACVSTGTFFKPSEETYLPNYDFYLNISRMNECLRHISAHYSEFIEMESKYRSRLGLSQYTLHITNFSLDAKGKKSMDRRSRLLLSYGEHAAEFFPVQSMFYLLENITRGFNLPLWTYGRNFTRFVLNNFDLYMLTIVNPDGRVIIERTKNHCWIGTANEIDLNSDLQHGLGDGKPIRIIAEPECRVIRELTSLRHFDALISFHSGQRKIFFPNTGKNTKVSEDTDVEYLASLMSSSMQSQYSIAPVKITPSDEGIFAFAVNERKITFTYKISLWGSEEKRTSILDKDCFSSLNPPSENLQMELEVVHPLYPTLFTYIHLWKESQLINEAENQDAKTGSPSFHTIIFFVMACVGTYFIAQLRVPFSWKIYFRRQRRIVSLRSLGTLFTLFYIP